VFSVGLGTEVISCQEVQNSVLLPVPEPLLGPVSMSAYSLQQQGQLYILSH